MQNKLSEVPLANLNQNELSQVKELENKMGEKFYLIAFKKEDMIS